MKYHVVCTLNNQPQLLTFKKKSEVIEWVFDKTLDDFWDKESNWIDHIFIGEKAHNMKELK